jgi:hypothetical protein
MMKVLEALIQQSKIVQEVKKKKVVSGTALLEFLQKTFNLPQWEEALPIADKLMKLNMLQNTKDKKGGPLIVEGATYTFPEKKDTPTKLHLKEEDKDIPKPILPKSAKSMNIIDLNPLEVARQITLIESAYFHKITPKELSHQNWNRPNAAELSPNLIRLIERTNDISYWVATEIVSEINLKLRVKIVKRFITIAEVERLVLMFLTVDSIAELLTTSVH